MKIIFHGAAGDIGKSCIEIRSGSKRYMLDAGVQFVGNKTVYPAFVEHVDNVDAVFLSHAHMDHSGALPLFEHRHLDCPIYTTALTWQTTELLLKDAFHLEQLRTAHPLYQQVDIHHTAQDVHFVPYDAMQSTKDGHVRFRYLNAGHIPGSASICMDIDGKRVLYTGDINTEKSLLMTASSVSESVGPVDLLIAEVTYGDREHPNRHEEMQRLRSSVEQTCARGGVVLIPAFGVGRAQEILLILAEIDPSITIYIDGMARELTQLFATTDDVYVGGRAALAAAMARVHMVGRGDRARVLQERHAVIIATSGMMNGGPVVGYADVFAQDADAMIALTGYQAEGTRGRVLLDKKQWTRDDGTTIPVACAIDRFDFSAHYGQAAIKKLIDTIPYRHVIFQHGERGSLETIASYARAAHPQRKVYTPNVGDELSVE